MNLQLCHEKLKGFVTKGHIANTCKFFNSVLKCLINKGLQKVVLSQNSYEA